MTSREDGYLEAVAGTTFRDRPLGGFSAGGVGIIRAEMEAVGLYMRSGLAGRIVDMPADDSTARGVTIEGDKNDAIAAEYARLGLMAHCADAVRWSRLFGGACLVLIAGDGRLLGDPLDVGNLDRIEEIKVFDPTLISVFSRYDDPMQANYGQPERYQIAATGTRNFIIHETRLVPIPGMPLPETIARTRQVPWHGRSALGACFDSIERYIAECRWVERMMERKQQAVYSMKGLAQLMAQQADPQGLVTTGQALIQARISAVDMARSLTQSVVVDSEDKYELRDLSMSGVKDAIDQAQVAVSADAGIAVTVLFGRSPGGQNSTGDSDWQGYYGLVGTIQNNDLHNALKRVTEVIVQQRSFQFRNLAGWKIKFNPLWVPSEQDQANTRLANANADQWEAQAATAYESVGAISAETIAKDLGAQGKFGLTPRTAVAAMPDDEPPDPVPPPADPNDPNADPNAPPPAG